MIDDVPLQYGVQHGVHRGWAASLSGSQIARHIEQQRLPVHDGPHRRGPCTADRPRPAGSARLVTGAGPHDAGEIAEVQLLALPDSPDQIDALLATTVRLGE
ncbi:hypothetical protein N0X72_00570 [Streptomyces carpaticus]|uniref:hypothetical protein n=1 Tax=Streptomyces carpaticus TaxID=285558 RepID=UPI0022022B36|nr:hypothetical protein N0X72_00570 [Streptomyces carpaticus]